MADRSRLNRRLVKQSEKNLAYSVIGIVIILFLMIWYGIPFLANMGTFFSNNKNQTTEEKKTSAFVSTPVLDVPFTATNSAQIKVSGISNKDYKVRLYVNDNIFDTKQVDNDNTFTFSDVKLDEGQNTIQVKAITKDKDESRMSDELTITFRHKEPTLTVDSPSDGQHYGKDDQRAHVSGKTDPGVKITVNDFWAIVDSTGSFSYDLPLKGGDQEVKIVATDDAGNTKTETRKINHDQ